MNVSTQLEALKFYIYHCGEQINIIIIAVKILKGITRLRFS